MDKKILIIILILVLIILIAVGFYYFRPERTAEEKETLGTEIGEATENPLKKMPETNPYEKVSNPFQYRNPFK